MTTGLDLAAGTGQLVDWREQRPGKEDGDEAEEREDGKGYSVLKINNRHCSSLNS